MSLINDALKKVSEAERGKPAPVQPDFEMRAVQPAPYESRPTHLLWLSVVLFIGAIGVGYYLFAKSRSATPQTVGEQSVKVAKSSTAVGEAKISAVEAPKITAPQVNVPNAAATPVTPEVSPVPAQPVPVSVGPKFRLKGILYTKNPTALINGASVQAGGEVDGAIVTKIESTSVTLDYQGKTTILKLGAQ